MPAGTAFVFVEAFTTERPFSGNRARVVLLDKLPDDGWMQGVAKPRGCAGATTFVRDKYGYAEHYDVRKLVRQVARRAEGALDTRTISFYLSTVDLEVGDRLGWCAGASGCSWPRLLLRPIRRATSACRARPRSRSAPRSSSDQATGVGSRDDGPCDRRRA